MKLEEIIGGNVRRLRKKKKWSQDVLAEKYDCLKAYISQIENGKTWIGKEVFNKLCEILDAKPEDLIFAGGLIEPLLAARIKRIQAEEYREIFDLLVEVLFYQEFIAEPDKEDLIEIKALLKSLKRRITSAKEQPPGNPGVRSSNLFGE